MRDGIRATLNAIKAAAERPTSAQPMSRVDRPSDPQIPAWASGDIQVSPWPRARLSWLASRVRAIGGLFIRAAPSPMAMTASLADKSGVPGCRVPCVRTVKTGPGATAMPIMCSPHPGSRETGHIGSAHDDVGLELLKATARQRLTAKQGELDLGLDAGEAGGPLPVAWRMSRLDARQRGGWCARPSGGRRRFRTVDTSPFAW
jgi:hypothetical protein